MYMYQSKLHSAPGNLSLISGNFNDVKNKKMIGSVAKVFEAKRNLVSLFGRTV
jgi:hypothetical protein